MTAPETAPPRARIGRRLATLAGTLLVAALAVGGVAGTTALIAGDAAPEAPAAAVPALAVPAVTIRAAEGYAAPRQFTGRLEPAQRSLLGFEEGGQIVALLAEEGDRVAKGAVLARLDTRLIEAERARIAAAAAALAAQIELARLTAGRQQDLAARDVASQQRADEARLRLAELEARQAEISAQTQALDIRADKAVLRAPYDGRVSARLADAGARVGPAAPVLEIVETDAPRVRLGVPADVAAGLAPGAALEVRLDGTPARLRLLSRASDLDPATRTRALLLAVETPLPQGMTFGDLVTVSLDRTVSEPGVWLPATALVEGTRGLWTVYLIAPDADGTLRARPESVAILHADAGRAFVRGALPDGTQVVAAGPHRIAAGQPVAPVPHTPAAEG